MSATRRTALRSLAAGDPRCLRAALKERSAFRADGKILGA
jgi:hypothetical protein